MTDQPPLTSAELAAIEARNAESYCLEDIYRLLRDLKAARAEIEHWHQSWWPVCRDTGHRSAKGNCPVHGGDACLIVSGWYDDKQLLAALTSHVASSQPRDGYVVLEVPREVYEKAVQAGGGA